MVAVGELRPITSEFISEETVNDALDLLCFTSSDRPLNPLEQLAVVDEALMSLELPATDLMRSYALSHILTSMITRELVKHRRAAGLASLEADTSRESALTAIASDSANPELLGWSWLYYHYVRVELDISVGFFCRTACINLRSLPRYRRRAVSRLTFQLIGDEEAARKKRRKFRLHSQLPSLRPVIMYGRDGLLKKTLDLSTTWPPCHTYIVGSPGIGKTAFVQKAVQSLIENEVVESTVWLRSPKSVREIEQCISQFLYEHCACATLREYVQRKRTVFVLDGVDDLCADLLYLETLLNDLGLALVYLTSRAILPIKNSMNYLVLSDLRETDGKYLIRRLLEKWHSPDQEQVTSDDVEYIWEHVGGNPRSIEQAVLDYRCDEYFSIHSEPNRIIRRYMNS